jgi:hypothetical protein
MVLEYKVVAVLDRGVGSLHRLINNYFKKIPVEYPVRKTYQLM